tara:strand:- start:499 stop:747 length:249 start_codon:yes stop_codon:yes gene_type:complete
MEKYSKFLGNITELIEKGLYRSKDFKKEFEDFVKFRVESVTSKLNLVSREEFEVQKKVIDKLQKELLKLKKKNSNKKTKKAR